jgi:hypothetical protein
VKVREGDGGIRGRRRGILEDSHSLSLREEILGEALGEIGNSGFTVHTGAEGFWARRARTSVDVLGPGVLVGRVVVLGCSSEGSSEDSSCCR